MSSNYDMDPLETPPWWPGVLMIVALAAALLAIAFRHV
jgi:hypothetical protein